MITQLTIHIMVFISTQLGTSLYIVIGVSSMIMLIVAFVSKYRRHERERLNTSNTIGIARVDVIPRNEEYMEDEDDIESHISSFSTTHVFKGFPPRVYI